MTMNIRRTQLAIRFRTLTVVAGLTALVVFLGGLAGAPFLLVFATFAVVANLAGYIYSDRLALRAAHARPLTVQQAPEAHAVVRELSARARIPMPRLYVTPGEQPNAFATGPNQRHAAIALTEGLLFDLPLEQVRGVLAHEISHIKNQDLLASALVVTIAGVVSAIVSPLELSFLIGADEEQNATGFLGWLPAVLLAPLGAMLLQLGISRLREYLADATAAQLLGSGRPLADALQQIDSDRKKLVINPVRAPMYTTDPLSAWRFRGLFSTHPPVSKRIRRLRAYSLRRPNRRPSDGDGCIHPFRAAQEGPTLRQRSPDGESL
jgi:heat shock protein HtpX